MFIIAQFVSISPPICRGSHSDFNFARRPSTQPFLQEILIPPCDRLLLLYIMRVSYFLLFLNPTHMISIKKYFIWMTPLFLLLVSCAEGGTLSESDLQATVDAAVEAAVEATTESHSVPTFTPIPTLAPENIEPTVSSAEEAAENEAAAVESESPPATSTATPLPTETHTPEPTATPSAPFVRSELADGAVRYELSAAQLGITLPADWLVADLTETAEDTTQTELKEILGSALFRNLVDAGVQFYAINWSEPSKSSLSPANINIATKSADGVSTAKALEAATVEHLAYELDVSPDDIGQSAATVSGLPAVRLDYFWEITTPKGDGVALQIVQYLLVVNDTAYTITITLPADLAPSLLPDAETAVQDMTFYAAE